MASHPSPLSQPTSAMGDADMTQTTTLDPKARWLRNYDEGEDLTAPKSRKTKYMNQSLISMIASAGLSSSISPDMFAAQETEMKTNAFSHRRASGQKPDSSSPQYQRRPPVTDRAIPAVERHRKTDRRMLQSSPGLSRLPKMKSHARGPSDNMLQSQILVPPTRTITPPVRGSPRHTTEAPSPVQIPSMQQVTVQEPSYPTIEPLEQEQETRIDTEADHNVPDTSLPEQLASMFGLENQEEVVAEYPCDLLQGIRQSGYMYLLQNYLCFYAYLAKRPSRTAKSGFLLKRGRRNPKFNRYWFVLKGDVLSYYTDRSNLYFPRNTIDLRSGVFTSLDQSDSDGAATFSIKTPQETLVFKAEDQSVAREWAEQIKRITFRSHHTGDSIKIRIPLKSILDIEDLQMGFTANMLSIKFVEDGEGGEDTLSVEEYIFSFVGADSESFGKLRAAAREPVKSDKPSSTGRSSDDMEDIALEDPSLSHPLASPCEDRVQDDVGTRNNEPIPHLRSRPHLQSASLSSSQQTISGPDSPLPRNDTFASISGLYRAGTERLRQASGIAGTIGQKSMLVGNMLANESKGYYEKMSGMWAGSKTHYDVNENPLYQHTTDDEDGRYRNHGDSFRQHFSLPSSEKLQATFFVHLLRNVPVYGKVYVGSTKLCFRSLALPQTKMILPFKDIESVGKEKGFTTMIYSGIVIVVKGHEELFFEFSKEIYRDDFALTMIHILDSMDGTQDSKMFGNQEKSAVEAAKAEHAMLQSARRNSKQGSSVGDLLPTSKEKGEGFASRRRHLTDGKVVTEAAPVIFDDFQASILDFKPQAPLHITCLTIGSRGDVQPYIALCKGLLEDGHNPVIATHAEFEPWIRSHGIDFRSVAGDPGKIMKLCVENDMFTIKFMQEAQSFRGFLDELFITSWEACQGADVLIESPSAMAGIHIAEALKIPYFRAFTMPWSPTRAYPHAFGVMNSKMGGKWNRYSYHVFDWAFWQSTAGQLNRFRTRTLRLPKTTFAQLRTYEVPFLYNFSPSVVPPPLDFGPQIHITGYWFLDEGKVYTPPAALLAFIAKARADGKKLVYVGFGSVTVDDPTAVTRAVSEAVEDADVRCILCKGWSDRLDKKDASEPEIPLPDTIFPIKAAPHDWLFAQVDAAVHHGGAGTTGASLRAGKPTVIKPFFGDQHFFASRVDDLGVGIALKIINSKSLALALREATCEQRMARRAKAMGERIRSENGVQTAIKMIYRDMEYARSLIKTGTEAIDSVPGTELVPESSEESWDLLSNESGTESPETERKSTSTLLDFPASLGGFRREAHGHEHFLDGETSASARSSDEGLSQDKAAFHEVYDSDE